MDFNEDNIEGFWQWFVKNERIIKDCIENAHSPHREFVVDQMNEQILSMGMLTWDVGLNDDDQWFMALSPNGSVEMLTVSQKIMAEAPDHMAWHFYASKPAKNWNRQFTIYDDEMDEQFIDASQWHFLVFEEENGKVELVLEAKNIPHLNDEIADLAAEQFVIQELSEETLMLHIANLVIVPEVESEDQAAKKEITELKEHLDELLKSRR